MSSPVENLVKGIVVLERSAAVPVYVQIARQVTNAIQRGVLTTGVRLPGTRKLSELLVVHRKTAVAAYEELTAQGWIETQPSKGTFVASHTTTTPSVPLGETRAQLVRYPEKSGFRFKHSMLLDRAPSAAGGSLELTDGQPDVRIAPLDKLAKSYASVLRRAGSHKHLGYSLVEGNAYFRDQLATYLNNTRGLHISRENILTTRGIQMGLYLASALLLEAGDQVIVGMPSYYVANMIFQQAGASVLSVPVDKDGISVEAVRDLCLKKQIRMLYLTPHHHYPSTVTLSAERRLALLDLSARYGFIILEDDHDYDFHYNSSPVLPLASADSMGMVVYVGSFCKALAPGLRSGYIVAPADVITELAKLRRVIDRQSDLVMEQVLGEMLREGEVQRHLKKAQKIYHQRRDHLSALLQDGFRSELQFAEPPGGLAVWTEWDHQINLLKVSRACMKHDLNLPQTLLFQTGNQSGVRLGFGNLNETELTKAMDILHGAVKKVG